MNRRDAVFSLLEEAVDGGVDEDTLADNKHASNSMQVKLRMCGLCLRGINVLGKAISPRGNVRRECRHCG